MKRSIIACLVIMLSLCIGACGMQAEKPQDVLTAERAATAPTEICQHKWLHVQSGEGSRMEEFLVCQCGWTCSTGEFAETHWEKHKAQYEEEEQHSDHESYSYTLRWVTDASSCDTWICCQCGAVSRAEP